MSERFVVHPTPIDGVVVIERIPRIDDRGFFERIYCDDELTDAGVRRPIRQINRTVTRHAGVARGFHLQRPPYSDLKVVSCLRGTVFDVAVDLRIGSSTFGQWHAEVLAADDHRSLVVPEGCAHGFQAMTDDCELLYLHTAAYVQEAEGGVSLFDPLLDVPWPLPVVDVSDRDRGLPMLSDGRSGVER